MKKAKAEAVERPERRGRGKRMYRRHPAPRLKIQVTQEIIDTALRKRSNYCMAAEAIRAQVPNAFSISVDLQSVRFSDKAKGLRYTYMTPRVLQDAIVRFDRGIAQIPPFMFRLTGAIVTSMKVGRRTGKRKLAHKLGRKKISAGKQELNHGTIPDVVGGKPPPTHRVPDKSGKFHASRFREFGLRAFTLDDVVPMPGEAVSS